MTPYKDRNQKNLQKTSESETCEFCIEIANEPFSRFKKMYGNFYKNRIIMNKDGFVVMPTIGQIFKGSLLIMPLTHYETMAELPLSMLKRLNPILAYLERKVEKFGIPILFEHGARCKTGASCGIYHAHLHLVPVPKRIFFSDVLPYFDWSTYSLIDAFDRLRQSDHYLLFRDSTGKFVALEPMPDNFSRFNSQYFRRTLAKHFNINAPWDWHLYDKAESRLIDTLNYFGYKDAFIG
jgi:diadenosine tetraphosphate (Ap4A) HIT family hydrolase